MKTHITIILLFAIAVLTLTCCLLVLNDCKNQDYYIIEMHDTEFKIKDMSTGDIIYTEQYETKSNIVNAILEDNQ